MSEPRPFHRLFGLSWIDFFEGTTVEVQTESDLSLKQQRLDLVLIRRGHEPIPRRLPDGFEELAAHNLVTFKSYQEALTPYALWELVGHLVNYHKQSSPSLDDPLRLADYRLFAVCARFPHNLDQEIGLVRRGEGVYDIVGLGLSIRLVVANQLPLTEHNARLLLFSPREDQLRYGREHYRPYSAQTSSLLLQLFMTYSEDPTMADPRLEEFYRESLANLAKRLTPEQRLNLVKDLPPEERLEGLPPEELRKRLAPEERLLGLSDDEVAKALEALACKRKANGSSEKPS